MATTAWRILAASLIAAALSPAVARPLESEQIARAVSVQGTVESQRTGQSAWTPVKVDDTYSAGDTIRVGPRSRADLALLDRSVLRLNENTTLSLQPLKPERTGVVDLLRGAVHFLSRGPRSLDVKTEFVAVGVRGTEFLVAVEPDSAFVTVFEGTVLAENSQGALTLSEGQSAVAQRGQGPVLQVVARPRDAVRWALYYPPVVDLRPDELPSDPAFQEKLRQSLAAYRQGDLKRAFDAIADVPPSVDDARFLTYRAQLLLAVGRTDEAGADLARVLAAVPRNADALSLQAIVAVVENDKDRALDLARAAVEAAPGSATALIALSYAQQARFDLDRARSSVERAVKLDANNALAWARLAEMHASFGDRGRSLDAARRATALAPDLSRTQTVLGYAYLREVNTSEARKAFERAIALDSADPLSRLGLGLARIRAGDLDRGARDIEIAASLAPNDAIVRSYLGKAYYEEKRTRLDTREYATAKELDPLDPTPYLYDAIAKQTGNRPVEALRDLERAIELNANRAVYRSRLLLDSDLAARSASLARIYGDLGFQQLALVEGWKSVEADATSDSAHRFLADSYAALPRREVARVSELLQAQLLQPINITPIQPRLAESNLYLISRGGPGALSFNEFNPLFDRDRLAFQLNGVGGDRSTLGVEPIVAGIYRNLSFSAGYSRFQTDGFRVNNDQKDDIANAFVQAELTSASSVQAEYRHRENDRGDLQSRFFPDLDRPALRQSDDSDTYRLGARHAFSPGSVVLASAMHQEARFGSSDGPAIQIKEDQDAWGGELQYIFRSRFIDLVSGAGYFKVTGDQRITIPAIGFQSTVQQGARHANGYAYAHGHLPAHLTLTLGVSADIFKSRSGASPDREQLNPKLGISWSPFPSTTVRAAAFRVLKRTLITDQTVEETQVAGFNQFFDDPDVTRSWRYGVGADQKISRDLFAGVEGTRRDLSFPALELPANVFSDVNWKEYQARGYLFWTPDTWLAVRAEYFFEHLVGEERLTLGAREANTHRVPLGLTLFLPHGLSASTTASYFHQDGVFAAAGPPGPGFRAGSEAFWLVDAALSWRLPRRHGLLGVSATNLLDKKFRLFEPIGRITNPIAQPRRAVLARLTLAAP